ncbi:MAG: hypothetical protein KKF30_11445 [Proteobacteria bacterium]|nr:hypothetical protein [Pseudomonadota bacterium]MBU4471229.1 hypothetical protein [Pseudomonadota bacterium]MCG2753204.1 hypothetical protein [Desulfobacteraceae bacterium]
MLIYHGEYHWEGWGGKLRLGHGKCRLSVFDLSKEFSGILHFKSHMAIVSDLADSPTSVKNYTGHIATGVTEKYQIEPSRLIWVEYYPEKRFGIQKQMVIPERFDETEFTWIHGKAIHPGWKPLKKAYLDILEHLMLKYCLVL